MKHAADILETIAERRDECRTHTYEVRQDPGGWHLRCVDCGAVELLTTDEKPDLGDFDSNETYRV